MARPPSMMERYAHVFAAYGLSGQELEYAVEAWSSELFLPDEVKCWLEAGVGSAWEASCRRRKGERPGAISLKINTSADKVDGEVA